MHLVLCKQQLRAIGHVLRVAKAPGKARDSRPEGGLLGVLR